MKTHATGVNAGEYEGRSDRDGFGGRRVYLVNAAAEALTGWTSTEAMERLWTSVFPVPDPASVIEIGDPI
jgi:hypothetical protein